LIFSIHIRLSRSSSPLNPRIRQEEGSIYRQDGSGGRPPLGCEG